MKRGGRVLAFRVPDQRRVKALFEPDGRPQPPTDLGLCLSDLLRQVAHVAPTRAKELEQALAVILRDALVRELAPSGGGL
jgi:hypothetical protein